MEAIIRVIEQVSEWSGRFISWFTSALVLLVCYDVVMSAFFDSGAIWIQELEWHFFALIFLIGMAYTLKSNGHVRVDVFYARFSPRRKAWVNLIGMLIFLLPLCIILLDRTWQFAWSSWQINEQSPDPGGLSARYLIKMAIPLGVFLLLLQGIAEGLKAIQVIRGVEAEENVAT